MSQKFEQNVFDVCTCTYSLGNVVLDDCHYWETCLKLGTFSTDTCVIINVSMMQMHLSKLYKANGDLMNDDKNLTVRGTLCRQRICVCPDCIHWRLSRHSAALHSATGRSCTLQRWSLPGNTCSCRWSVASIPGDRSHSRLSTLGTNIEIYKQELNPDSPPIHLKISFLQTQIFSQSDQLLPDAMWQDTTESHTCIWFC